VSSDFTGSPLVKLHDFYSLQGIVTR
jgi:hypothetical protein